MVKVPASDWITTAEAAEILGVSLRRVQALMKAGRLPATRIGVQHLLQRSDVLVFAKKPRTPGRPAKPAAKKPAKGKK